MINLAYLVFTFVACILGVGFGLLLHHLNKSQRQEPAGLDGTVASEEDATFEKLALWQAENNRRFALHISSCAALPLFVAAAGYGNRSDVVGVICSHMLQVAGHSPLCF